MVSLSQLRHELRAWRVLEAAAIRAQHQYRSNLVAGLVGGIVYQGIQLVFLALLLHSFGMIGGWGMPELGLMVGIRLAAHAVYVLPFGALLGTWRAIHSGDLDLFLLRPVSILTQIITQRFNILTIGDAVVGASALIAFSIYSPVEWTTTHLLYLLAAVVGGGLVETAIQVAIASLAFKVSMVSSFQVLADTIVTTYGIYPLTIFGRGLYVLCLIFPLGFIAYLPTTVLLGQADHVPLPTWLVTASPLGGWVLLVGAIVIFRRMSRHYVSPGA